MSRQLIWLLLIVAADLNQVEQSLVEPICRTEVSNFYRLDIQLISLTYMMVAEKAYIHHLVRGIQWRDAKQIKKSAIPIHQTMLWFS